MKMKLDFLLLFCFVLLFFPLFFVCFFLNVHPVSLSSGAVIFCLYILYSTAIEIVNFLF